MLKFFYLNQRWNPNWYYHSLDFGVMAVKGYSTFSKTSLLEITIRWFHVIFRLPVGWVGGLTPTLQRCSWHILWPPSWLGCIELESYDHMQFSVILQDNHFFVGVLLFCWGYSRCILSPVEWIVGAGSYYRPFIECKRNFSLFWHWSWLFLPSFLFRFLPLKHRCKWYQI